MAVRLPNSYFFHIPKTGGTWVQASLENAVDGAVKIEAYFGEITRWDGIHVPTDRLNTFSKPSFVFVRHPLDWYKSIWRYHNTGKRWSVTHATDDKFDQVCPHREFSIFIDKVIEFFPDGYYSHIAKPFVETADYVGKTENLYFDLLDFLDDIGEDYDEDKILSQHINVSDHDLEAEYTDKQRDAILDMESWIIEGFYE